MDGTRKVGNTRNKLTLKLGNIPLEGKLVRVSQESESGLSQFSPAGNPIGYKKVDKVTGVEVSSDQILKGKMIGDTVVTFTEAELDTAYATRQKEISQVRVEDIQDIPATYIKSIYWFKPENETFWGLIGGRLVEGKKQLRFTLVEGRQERSAVLQIKGNVGLVQVSYFPSEVAEIGQQSTPACKPELAQTVDALLTGLSATVLPEPEEKRNVVIDKLVEAKLTGQPIPTKPVVEAKVQKGKSVEDLLKESIAIVNAK
jgi:non-homologous end joining protein Ku